MNSTEYLRHAAYLRHASTVGESNTDNDDYFCPVTIRRALEIAHEIEDLRAQVEAQKALLQRWMEESATWYSLSASLLIETATVLGEEE